MVPDIPVGIVFLVGALAGEMALLSATVALTIVGTVATHVACPSVFRIAFYYDYDY